MFKENVSVFIFRMSEKSYEKFFEKIYKISIDHKYKKIQITWSKTCEFYVFKVLKREIDCSHIV